MDFLVNNAGIQIAQDSDMLETSAFNRVLAVNLRGAFLCAQHAIRQMIAEDRPGAIVNVSSVHQLIPKPKFLGYSVSKGGMQNLTRTLALSSRARDPSERDRTGRDGHADQPRVGRGPREARDGRESHPNGTRG